MRKKYFLPIGILILTLVISVLVIIENKVEKDKNVLDETLYITEEQEKEIEQEKEKLVRLCEENQEELEAMSKEYLALMKELGKSTKDLTYEEFIDVEKQMEKQMKYTEWEVLSDILNLDSYISDYAGDFEGNVYYRCWNKWGYELDLIYIDVDAEKVLEYMVSFVGCTGEIIKVNEHLYVYLRWPRGV
ncbi:MAG: hypothetical protein IJA10_06045 [Lachnospiraceae bacterium]|nr:hypothetical protein [Lachnospiraceae bacterium]